MRGGLKERGGNDFLPLKNVFHWFSSNRCCHNNVGALKQVHCLEIQSETRDSILIVGSKTTPENTLRRTLKVVSSNSFIHSAENDHYHKCAGDTMRKCLIKGSLQLLEHEQGDPHVVDDADDTYIRCIEVQTKTCHHPIIRHFYELIEAFKKHVKQLEMLESEEQQG